MPITKTRDGVLLITRCAASRMQLLDCQVRDGSAAADRAKPIQDLLVASDTLYPPQYAVPAAYQQRALEIPYRLASAFSTGAINLADASRTALNDLVGPFIPRGGHLLELPPPATILQGPPELLPMPVAGASCWHTHLCVPRAGRKIADGLGTAKGATAHLCAPSLRYTKLATSFLGTGQAADIPSLHLGAALVSKEDTPATRARSYNMASNLVTAMSEHVDAALTALRRPEDFNEIRSALHRAYEAKWIDSYEAATNIIFDYPTHGNDAAASLPSVVWFQEKVFFVQSGLNSILLLESDCVKNLVQPSRRPTGDLLLLLSQKRWPPALHNKIHAVRSNKGIFKGALSGNIRPTSVTYNQAALDGKVAVVSNMEMRNFITSEQIMQARTANSDPSALATALVAMLRQAGAEEEILLAMVNFFYTTQNESRP